MEDVRVRVSYDKKINLGQLDQELGGHGLCGSDTEIVAVEGSPVTAAELQSAIDTHVAVDDDEIRQATIAAAVQHAKSLGFTDDMIVVMYPNLTP